MEEAIRLTVVAIYQSATENYKVGSVIEVPKAKAEWLMRDAPGCFVLYVAPKVEVEADVKVGKSIDAPPVDKMIRAPRKDK